MDEIRAQQIEVLEFAISYIPKLGQAIKEILPELQGEEKPDTQDYLKQIIDGINMVIEIANGTLDFINEKEVLINKDGIEEKVQLLSRACLARDNGQIALELETGMLPFLDIFYQISSVLLAQKNE